MADGYSNAQHVAQLREAVNSAQLQQDDDTDHPRFCVVSNLTVSQIIRSFRALDQSGAFDKL